MYIPYFPYLFIHWWIFRLFPQFVIVNNAAVHMTVKISLWDLDFNLFRYAEAGLLDYMMCEYMLSHVLTLCDPMGCNSPGSSVHEIFQAKILEWVAFSFSKDCMIALLFFFWKRYHTLFHNDYTSLCHQQCRGSSVFPHACLLLFLLACFDSDNPTSYEVIFHCGFDLHFPEG